MFLNNFDIFPGNPLDVNPEDYKGSLFSSMTSIDFITRISCLGLAHLKLEDVPHEVFNQKLLKKLNLSHNELTELPEELCGIRCVPLFLCDIKVSFPSSYLLLSHQTHTSNCIEMQLSQKQRPVDCCPQKFFFRPKLVIGALHTNHKWLHRKTPCVV